MYSKLFIVAAFAAIASAQLSGHSHDSGHGHGQSISSQSIALHQTDARAHYAPVVHHQPSHFLAHESHYEHDAPTHYAFEYNVHDAHTGDIKSQHETREGDAVHGFYSLHEADGTVRRVEYTVDKHSGFNAIIHRKGQAKHEAPAHHHH